MTKHKILFYLEILGFTLSQAGEVSQRYPKNQINIDTFFVEKNIWEIVRLERRAGVHGERCWAQAGAALWADCVRLRAAPGSDSFIIRAKTQ